MATKVYAIISGRTDQPIEYRATFAEAETVCARYNEDESSQPDVLEAPWKALYHPLAVVPSIPDDQFFRLCEHPAVRANRMGKRVMAARLVLVNGERISAAARFTGTTQPNVSTLVAKMIRAYYGFAPTKKAVDNDTSADVH